MMSSPVQVKERSQTVLLWYIRIETLVFINNRSSSQYTGLVSADGLFIVSPSVRLVLNDVPLGTKHVGN